MQHIQEIKLLSFILKGVNENHRPPFASTCQVTYLTRSVVVPVIVVEYMRFNSNFILQNAGGLEGVKMLMGNGVFQMGKFIDIDKINICQKYDCSCLNINKELLMMTFES
jgi:hypothetical protein